MAGLFEAIVGQGDLRPHDMNVGTRGLPAVKDGRLNDYNYHLNRWLKEIQRGRDTTSLIKKDLIKVAAANQPMAIPMSPEYKQEIYRRKTERLFDTNKAPVKPTQRPMAVKTRA